MKITKGTWNGWSLDTESRELTFQDRYPIEVDRLLTSAHFTDWVYQIKDKSWMTQSVMWGFIEAVDDLWGGAQVGLAPSGMPRIRTEEEMTRRLRAIEITWRTRLHG